MSLSTRGNASDATQLIENTLGMQPVGPAAVVPEGKGTQLRKITKTMGQITHPAMIF